MRNGTAHHDGDGYHGGGGYPGAGSPGGRPPAAAGGRRATRFAAAARGTLDATRRVLVLVWGTHRGLTTALAVLTLLRSPVPAREVWLGKLVIDALAGAIHHGDRAGAAQARAPDARGAAACGGPGGGGAGGPPPRPGWGGGARRPARPRGGGGPGAPRGAAVGGGGGRASAGGPFRRPVGARRARPQLP